MADNFAKLWLQNSLNRTAITRAKQVISTLGKSLPCRVVAVNGAIVTVAFEINASPWTLPSITIPKLESNWIRMPTQIGDLGWTVPADVYLGGVSGLGGGVANAASPNNLSALVFAPISSANSPPIDQNAAQVQGPNGVISQTTLGTTSSVVTNQSGTTITFDGNTLTLDSSGLTVTVGGVSFLISSSGITHNGNTQLNGNIGQTGVGGAGTATFSAPITAPDVILPNGAVNAHYHYVPAAPGNSGAMTG